ncbi:uncharacterized protein METZ01_LOCUS319713 [marine metagenome]|uniref:HTH crp-type domain-containing protein n=1 Tax=marine metagenome TaxID=408172 RepID=A0A382P0D6_9ZZZZ
MVSKVMGAMRDEGLLHAGQKHIDLSDRDGLVAIAEGRQAAETP